MILSVEGEQREQVLSSEETVRAVVLSDIHATFKAEANRTHVAEATAGEPRVNALTAARAVIRDNVGTADLLLCPGDLVHQGDGKPMKWVWRELQDCAHDLGAQLIGAVGNHDLLRKPRGTQEPAEMLRALQPRFPYEDDVSIKSYWSDNWAVTETSHWRVVTLNTCSRHGGYDPKVADCGMLMPYCIPGIEKYLAKAPTHPPVNICMCHHHPQEWRDGGGQTIRHLTGGDVLIDLLESREERWMLLHGHKHHPVLGYYGRSSHGPVRLSAGSIGINLLEESGVEIRNQMHMVEFAVGLGRHLGLPLAGIIESYTWTEEGSWEPAISKAGLASLVGFGYRRDGVDLARELVEKAHDLGLNHCTWSQLTTELEPRAAFLAPPDRHELLRGIRLLGGGVQEDEPNGVLEVTFP
jgi:calcineurin-like phosphoesterase family protein